MELEKEGLGLLNGLQAQFKRFVNPDIGRKEKVRIKVLDSIGAVLRIF